MLRKPLVRHPRKSVRQSVCRQVMSGEKSQYNYTVTSQPPIPTQTPISHTFARLNREVIAKKNMLVHASLGRSLQKKWEQNWQPSLGRSHLKKQINFYMACLIREVMQNLEEKDSAALIREEPAKKSHSLSAHASLGRSCKSKTDSPSRQPSIGRSLPKISLNH